MADITQAETTRDTPPFLYRLLDEILLNVTHCLPQWDLYQLSLVSKHIGFVAQESLYRTTHVPYTTFGGSGIAMLAATLVNRPNLAGKVLGLDLEPHVDFVGACSNLFRPRDESTNSIMKNLTVLMRETEIVGLILGLASNLRDLVLDVRIGMEADRLHHAHAHNVTEHIFGYAYDHRIEKLDLLSIPGLSHLRYLRLKSRTLQWAWCQLLQLTSLSLRRFCEVMDYEAYPEEIW